MLTAATVKARPAPRSHFIIVDLSLSKK